MKQKRPSTIKEAAAATTELELYLSLLVRLTVSGPGQSLQKWMDWRLLGLMECFISNRCTLTPVVVKGQEFKYHL